MLHGIRADAVDSGNEYDAEDDGPTAGEIADYARRILGLDPVWDTDLMWYACSVDSIACCLSNILALGSSRLLRDGGCTCGCIHVGTGLL